MFWSKPATTSGPSPNTSQCDAIPNSVECFYDKFKKIDDNVLQTLIRPTNISIKNIVMMITLIGEDKLVEEYKQWINVLEKDVLLAFDKLILDKLKQEAQNFTLDNMIDLIEQCKGNPSKNLLVQKLWTDAKFGEVLSYSVGVQEHLATQTGGKKTKKTAPKKKTKPASQKKK